MHVNCTNNFTNEYQVVKFISASYTVSYNLVEPTATRKAVNVVLISLQIIELTKLIFVDENIPVYFNFTFYKHQN